MISIQAMRDAITSVVSIHLLKPEDFTRFLSIRAREWEWADSTESEWAMVWARYWADRQREEKKETTARVDV